MTEEKFKPFDFSSPDSLFWDFWQISGRYAKWSKYHLFQQEGQYSLTACGRWPEPDNYMPIVNSGKEPLVERRCKKCQRIYEKEVTKND